MARVKVKHIHMKSRNSGRYREGSREEGEGIRVVR